jgi:glycosyltransferase involved in cell wall biosynthesis
MNVCLDFQPAVSQRAGVGRYTDVLARELGALVGDDDALRLFYLDFKRRAAVPPVPGATFAPWRGLPGAVLQQAWKRVGWPPFDALAGAADVYHFTNFIIPPLRRGRAVVTIYDMSFERFPQFAESKNQAYLSTRIRETVRRADAVITISEFSAAEIRALIPEAEGKTHAIPLGISPDFRPAAAAEVTAMRAELGLERPYLLTVGTVEPRKNLTFLVDVFEQLEDLDIDLAIVGMPGWKCEPILERFRTSRRADRIHYLKYLPDGALPAVYSGAEAFVVASHYEGFGFPPLEAMACGTPVVSSPGGSLREVLGDGADFPGSLDVELWASRLCEVIRNREHRQRLIEAGRQQAAAYRWSNTAAATWQVYREVTE